MSVFRGGTSVTCFFLTELHGENEVDTLLRALLFTLVPIAYDTQMSMSLRGAHGNGMNLHVPIVHQSILLTLVVQKIGIGHKG